MTGLLGTRLFVVYRAEMLPPLDGVTVTAARAHTTHRVHEILCYVCVILCPRTVIIMCVFRDYARFIHQVRYRVATQCMRSAIFEPRLPWRTARLARRKMHVHGKKKKTSSSRLRRQTPGVGWTRKTSSTGIAASTYGHWNPSGTGTGRAIAWSQMRTSASRIPATLPCASFTQSCRFMATCRLRKAHLWKERWGPSRCMGLSTMHARQLNARLSKG